MLVGFRLACLPLPFICLPLLFICLPVLFRVGFCGAGLSPTSCHLSPTSFHLSPRLGACGRVPGWLVSHFLSFVSHFFSFVRLGLVVGFAAGLSPTCFHLSPTSFICLPVLFICLPVLFIFGLPGWVLVVGFPAGLSRICLLLLFTCLLSFHLSGSRPACLPLPFPLLFICLPVLFIVSGACGRGFAAGLSPTSFHLSPTSFHLSPTSFHLSPTSYHLSPRLGACGRVSGWLVSHFLSYVSHFFSFVSLGACGRVCGWLVSHVLSFVSHFFHLSPSSFHLSPTSFHSPNSLLLGVLNALKNGRLGAGWSGRVPSRLVSHFLCLPVLFSRGSRLACLPLPFICLPILFICLPGHFLSFVSHFFSLSPRLGACGRVPGRLVSHFPFVSHFFSFVSHLSPPLLPFICLPLLFCLWSGSRPACLPLPLICLPLLFICHPLLFICLPGWVLVVGFPPASHLLSFVSRFFSFISQKCFICLPGPSLLVPCSISIHLSLSLLISALFRWPCSISIHLSPRLVTGGVRPFPLFLFICLPGLSLLVSALFRWPCSISIHLSPRSVTASVLSPRSVTAGVRPFRRPCSISIH